MSRMCILQVLKPADVACEGSGTPCLPLVLDRGRRPVSVPPPSSRVTPGSTWHWGTACLQQLPQDCSGPQLTPRVPVRAAEPPYLYWRQRKIDSKETGFLVPVQHVGLPDWSRSPKTVRRFLRINVQAQMKIFRARHFWLSVRRVQKKNSLFFFLPFI